MKIFALYTTIALTKKPDWLDGFMEKYQPRGLHVTLKQPCLIEEENIDDLKQMVAQFFSHYGSGRLEVVFDEVVYNKDVSGAIMVCARNADTLVRLQKDLCLSLSKYSRYVELRRKEYEVNFRPHITIGDEITEEDYVSSLSFLKNGCLCEGVIGEVVLAIVDDMSTEEAINPKNKYMFRL
ncbi:MAG: 2'-5' RNA ligase family protein [bacterium]|nr:2'-5' RNA ligase family protein [bacterium]